MGTLEESIVALREYYPPLAGIPEDQLLRLVRTYELDPGDSVTFKNDHEECIFRQWLNRLRNPLIFGQLPLENAHAVFRRLQPVTATKGEVIFDMKEEATKFYFIEKGSAGCGVLASTTTN